MIYKRPRCDSDVTHVEFAAHRKDMLEGLNKLRQQRLLLDVVLVAEGCELHAHKTVLAACSEYFRALFAGHLSECKTKEVHLDGVTARGLRLLIEFAYTSKLVLTMDNVNDILAAADYVQMQQVVQECARYLRSQLTLTSALMILNTAEKYSLTDLELHTYQFICNRLTTFSMLSAFADMTIGQLSTVLDGGFSVDCSEVQVLLMVIVWIKFDKVNRIVFAQRLFDSINYMSISPEDITRIAEEHGIFRQAKAHFSNVVSICVGSEDIMSDTTHEELPPNVRGLQRCMVTVGGFLFGGITNKIMCYKLDTKQWDVLTEIPHIEQCNFGVSVISNKLYVVGGCFNQSLQEQIHPFGFCYDPRMDEWSVISPMSQERCRFYLGMVAGKLYAIGGAVDPPDLDMDDGFSTSSCECYSPTDNQWSYIQSLPARRTQHSGAEWKQFIFICGGLVDYSVTATLLCYDTVQNTWEKKAPMLRPRADHCVITYENKLVVAGGWYEDDNGRRIILDTLDCYDIETDTWSVVTQVPTPRYHTSMVLYSREMYLIGGFTENRRPTRLVECYDPETDTWSTEGDLSMDIWEHAACNLYTPVKHGYPPNQSY